MDNPGNRYRLHSRRRVNRRGVIATLPDNTTIRGVFHTLTDERSTPYRIEGRTNPNAVNQITFTTESIIIVAGTMITFPFGVYAVSRVTEKMWHDTLIKVVHEVVEQLMPGPRG